MNSDYKLLGWSFKRTPENKNQTQAIVPKDINDGSLVYSVLPDSYGTIGTGWSTNEVDSAIKSDAELVNKYREMSLNPIVDRAISEIANEAITMSETEIVKLNLEKVVNLPPIAKTKITESFEEILNLLNYRLNGYSSFRQWYVDGRIYYHTMIDIKDPTRGIVDIRNIDPRKIKKIKEVVKKRSKNSSGVNGDAVVTDTKNEYYIFNDSGFVGKRAKANGIKLTLDSVAYATSGLNAVDGVSTLSYLHYASRYLNQLTTTENAMVIYMLARAPERRTWYIDTGNLPTMKAEQYVQSVMNRYKNKVVYDATTGEVRDDRKYMCYAMDTKIPLLDGRTLTLEELTKEYESGKTNWVYSCDPKTGKFVPGPVSWAGVTKRNSEVVRVTFDNGKSVICTPDHKFPVWNKGFVEAKDIVGESIIPGYRRSKAITNGGNEYEQIYKNDTKTWEFTHREIAKWKDSNGVTDDSLEDVLETDRRVNQTELKESELHNHKAISVEFLSEKIDVGCISVDRDETYHSHHTYLLDAGVYTKNTMLEDFFLPRRNGSRGTEVNTLPAGQATTQMDNVEYFKRQLYESLNVPTERLNASNPFSSGMDTAISREEIKFGKFIERLRQQYSEIFRQLLGKQIILKNIITEDEWNDFKNEIVFDFARDNFFLEMKDSEATKLKLSIIETMESAQIIGRYVSNETVRKKVLKQTDEEIKKEDELIIKEKFNPIFNIPSIDPNTGLPMPDPTSLALNNQYAQVPFQNDQQDQSSTSNSSQNNAKK